MNVRNATVANQLPSIKEAKVPKINEPSGDKQLERKTFTPRYESEQDQAIQNDEILPLRSKKTEQKQKSST
jgi:hypothetical protein